MLSLYILNMKMKMKRALEVTSDHVLEMGTNKVIPIK
jgi:hypothetical protein